MVDERGNCDSGYEEEIVRADVPSRRAESKYTLKQVSVTMEYYGGELNGVSYF